jgi:hypothetical protein
MPTYDILLNDSYIMCLYSIMAGFHTKTFIKHDDYMTPKHAWIVPRRRIHFIKQDADGTLTATKGCNFDCFYYCYKIGLENDIMWLE